MKEKIQIFLKKEFIFNTNGKELKLTGTNISLAIFTSIIIGLITSAILIWGFLPLFWLGFIWLKTEAKKLTFKFIILNIGKRIAIDLGVMPQLRKHVFPKIGTPIKYRIKHTWSSVTKKTKIVTGFLTATFGTAYIAFASGAKTLTAIFSFIITKLSIAKFFSAILSVLIAIKSLPFIGRPISFIIDVVIFDWIAKLLVKITPKRIIKIFTPIIDDILKVIEIGIDRIDKVFGTHFAKFGDKLANWIWSKTHKQSALPAPREIKRLAAPNKKISDS